MTILANILEVKQAILNEKAQSGSSDTSARLKRKSFNAILGGPNEWITYMKEFAKTPEELARLVPIDGSENQADMNDARAYLIAKSACGTDTVTTFENGITEILDQ